MDKQKNNNQKKRTDQENNKDTGSRFCVISYYT